ncbi:hypothetical protein GQ55_3G219500 [Panicum hallii var. hallii]|uniref:Uncharacterized protein n=1 Tax=Panicum hallii var. hallii TaxID=1504633 RepID=A0A2T7EC39_9POAL|nr:hypothetical protein GQ55_3G219500 [Panicum hallii var. hallii]
MDPAVAEPQRADTKNLLQVERLTVGCPRVTGRRRRGCPQRTAGCRFADRARLEAQLDSGTRAFFLFFFVQYC